jgi:hypothetical protein
MTENGHSRGKVPLEIWAQLREHLTTWAIGGTLIIVTGFTPEEWLARLFESIDLPRVNFDVRIILVLLGVTIVAGDASPSWPGTCLSSSRTKLVKALSPR